MAKWTVAGRAGGLFLLVALATPQTLGAEEDPPEPVEIHVAASRGEIIPQSRGGGGFQRSFRFTADPAEGNHWIRQVLEVRGTVFDAGGETRAVHLDVIEYYRVDSTGRAIQADSHYNQFWEACGGDLTIGSTLTYGTLEARKLGDPILGKSFILRAATDAAGELVTMRTRTTRRVIPAEHGERVEFHVDRGSIPSTYAYRVQWDARAGSGSRTQPSGDIETGTWKIEYPQRPGPTQAAIRPRPIPRIERRR